MARVTVEDCLAHLPNRFTLVLATAERTKQLLRGADPQLPDQSDNKEVVTALREIAAGMFLIDDSAVIEHDDWMPHHRRRQPEPVSDEEELPPEF
jgi:DNA-directed RNA polymerase subunit omega